MIQLFSQAKKSLIKNNKFVLISYLTCSQIWLNLLVNHHHFGYITKLTPKKKNKQKQTLVVGIRYTPPKAQY
jgi:hypothetical protein